jgi:zinc finger HIT domain-containing protein 1
MSAPAAKKAKGSSGAALSSAASAAQDRRSGRLSTKFRVRSVVDPETRRQVAAARLVALEQDNYEEPSSAAVAAGGGDAAYEDEDEEVEQGGGGGSKSKKRRRPTAGTRVPGAAAAAASAAAAAAAGGDVAAAGKGSDRAAKAVVHRTRNLDYVVAEEEYDSDGVNYKTIAASVTRLRHRTAGQARQAEPDSPGDSRNRSNCEAGTLTRLLMPFALCVRPLLLSLSRSLYSGPSTRPQRHFCSVCGFFASYTCSRCGLRFCCLRCQHTHKETRCIKFAE